MQILFLREVTCILSFPGLLNRGDTASKIWIFLVQWGLPGLKQCEDFSQLQLVQRFLHQYLAAESSWVKT